MPTTNMVRPQGEANPHAVTKADAASFSQKQPRVTEGHLTSEAALGLCWLVLPVLPCFGRPNQTKKYFGT